MLRATRMIPLALALVVGIAPTALAKHTVAQASGTSQQKMTGMHQMLPGGVSMKGQLDHAYAEALNVHSALAMGMEDMGKNHLANVELVIRHINETATEMSAPTKSQLAAIRVQTEKLEGSMDDREAALKGSSALVSRFVTLYDQMASAMPMGGGGGATRPMKSASEIMADAGGAAAMTQSSLASRNYVLAANHAKDLQQQLKMAELAMMAHGLKAQSTEVKHVKALQSDARTLMASIDSRSPNATKQAGKMVTKIGDELPLVASATTGGGGGTMPHEEH